MEGVYKNGISYLWITFQCLKGQSKLDPPFWKFYLMAGNKDTLIPTFNEIPQNAIHQVSNVERWQANG
jgi:hypothetical protein